MKTMLIISIVLVAIPVVAAIYYKKELPKSISDLVYYLPKKWQWLWTMWIWVVSLLTLIPAIDRLSMIGMEALGFGSLACLAFCGAMPLIDKENTTMHWVFGISGCVLSQACVYFIHYESLWVWMVFPFLFLSSYIQPEGWLGKAMKGKGVLLGEVICYVCLIGSLLTI